MIEFSSPMLIPKGSLFEVHGDFWNIWNGSKYQCLSKPQFLSKQQFTASFIQEPNSSWSQKISKLRFKIIQWVDQHFSQYNAQYFKVLFLGDKSDFPIKDKKLFSSFGILYLLAISGFHIQFMYGGLKSLVYLIPGNPKLKYLLLWAMFTPIIPLTGYGPAVFRAVVAQGIKELSLVSESHWPQSHQFFSTLIICFLIEPTWILNLGFQLSFAATFAIQQFKWIDFKPQALSISLRALLGTIIILLVQFESISLLGIITQLASQIYIAMVMALNLLQSLLELLGTSHGFNEINQQLHQLHIKYLQTLDPLNQKLIFSNKDPYWIGIYGVWIIYSLYLVHKTRR